MSTAHSDYKELLSFLRKNYILIFILAFAIYGLLFILQTSVVIDGERYFSLFDDQMVSMRYAKHLAQGEGLVWNVHAEKVEGYTNPAWVLIMSFWHFFPTSPAKISLFIQLCSLLFLTINLFFVYKIVNRLTQHNWLTTSAALLLTAFYFPLNYYSLHGCETSLLTLIISYCLWRRLIVGSKQDWPSYFLLAGVTLVRLDAVIIFLCFWLVNMYQSKRYRKSHFLLGFSYLFVVLLGQTLFRFVYYQELLPNTYYLKMTGYPLLLRWARGFRVLWNFTWQSNILFILIPFAILVWQRNIFVKLSFLLLTAQAAYSVYVGGDAWEWYGGANRYIVIVMPVLFILFALSLQELLKRLSYFREHRKYIVGYALITIAMLFSFNNLRQFSSPLDWIFLNKPLEIIQHHQQIALAKKLETITDKEATVAVVWAGTIPYFLEREYVDLLGKNDAYIAHLPMHRIKDEYNNEVFYPGHLKWDYNYSIGKLKPDIIVQLWFEQTVDPSLLEDYSVFTINNQKVWIRNNSSYINWEKL